jgi:hypothetical protein
MPLSPSSRNRHDNQAGPSGPGVCGVGGVFTTAVTPFVVQNGVDARGHGRDLPLFNAAINRITSIEQSPPPISAMRAALRQAHNGIRRAARLCGEIGCID